MKQFILFKYLFTYKFKRQGLYIDLIVFDRDICYKNQILSCNKDFNYWVFLLNFSTISIF